MKIISENRKATYAYSVCDMFNAGLVLHGSEVKSVRKNGASISEAYIIARENELYVKGMYIPEYKFASLRSHEPKRERKLLLKKREIIKIATFLKLAGGTAIPLNLYFSDKNYVKMSLCTAKGKNVRDKREDIKRREWQREKGRLFAKIL